LKRREQLEICESEKSLGCFGKHWMESETAKGSHKVLSREGWPDYVFAFHDGDEIGSKMLPRIAKKTGLKPEDL